MTLPARLRTLALALALGAGPALLGCGEETPNEDPFTSEGFADGVEAVKEDAGEDAQLVQVQISQGRALFKTREGDSVSVLVYPGDPAEPIGPEAAGVAPDIESFPVEEIDPDAVDRILTSVGEELGPQAEVTAMTLQRRPNGELGWTVDALPGQVTFFADADGSDLARRS